MVLLMGDFNVDSRKPYIETDKVRDYPGFKVSHNVWKLLIRKIYPHLAEDEHFNEYEAMKCYISDNYRDDLEDLLFVRT